MLAGGAFGAASPRRRRFIGAPPTKAHRAQYNLAVAYRDGKGVEQDRVQAYMWFTLSAAAGGDLDVHDKASKERDDLAKEMTPGQVAQAEAEAVSWKPTVRHAPWPLAPGETSPYDAWPHHP
jgi:TPR repeat protein